jgi:hypothetical protein
MRLRTAIKILNNAHWNGKHFRQRRKSPRYRCAQVCVAKQLARRKWLDCRFPFIGTEEEEHEQFGLLGSVLIDISVDDEKEADKLKDEWWTNIYKI